ncbi:protein SMG9 [Drosophila innubila]|uniref:protein SMG9 n=1 Tax=Drosophila innubila TaxID=198719 RepID=UPI00148DA4B1|nr:protein SMG9 [Drosophila innubila]
MSENRRRFRNKKRDDARQGAAPSIPVTIARREDARSTVVQPKILLKKEAECHTASGSSGSNNEILTSIKTIIINRSDARGSSERASGGNNNNNITSGPSNTTTTSTSGSSSVCAALAGSSYTPSPVNKEKTNGTTAAAPPTAAAASVPDLQLPPRMTRPTSLLISNGVYNTNARKLFHKTNTDFTVIGVFGAQSVGKSTLLNLLTVERDSDYDYYQHLFSTDADDCIFPIRHRGKQQQQNSKRARTESLQFFITRERYVLLDAASVSSKETDHLELQTMSTMMQLLSVCHVLLLALDELSLEQLRLLNAALRLRPRAPFKGYVDGYLPQLMFVRTRAQRQHFDAKWRVDFDKQLELLFNDTGLSMHRGRGDARVVNSFLLPEVQRNGATAHHASLFELVRQFRERVLTMVRHPICHCNDFTELLWFELLTETTRKCNASSQHFEKILVEIKQRHVESRSKWRNDANWRNES